MKSIAPFRTGPTGTALTVNLVQGGTVIIPIGSAISGVGVPYDPYSQSGYGTVAIAGSQGVYNIDESDMAHVAMDNGNNDPPLVGVYTHTWPAAQGDGPDNAGRQNGQFVIVRTGRTTQSLTVNYAVQADDFSDYDYTGYVTIPQGESSATVDYVPPSDAYYGSGYSSDKGYSELRLTLTAPNEPGEYAVAQGVYYADLPVKNADVPRVTISDAVAGEGDDETFTVTLSKTPLGDVVVPYSTADSTAFAGTNYTSASGSLTFAAGTSQLSQTITVPTLLDPQQLGGLAFRVSLSGASGEKITGAQVPLGNGTVGYAQGLIDQVKGSLTIFNESGVPTFDGTDLVGGYVPIEVRLTSPAVVGGNFGLDYDSDTFTITTDPAGLNVIEPDQLVLTPSRGGQMLYLWGVQETADPTYEDIVLGYGFPSTGQSSGTFSPSAAVMPPSTMPLTLAQQPETVGVVHIFAGSTDLTSSGATVPVGLKVTLTCKVVAPSGITPLAVKWSPIPGDTVKDYQLVREKNDGPTYLTALDYAAVNPEQSISFAWVDSGATNWTIAVVGADVWFTPFGPPEHVQGTACVIGAPVRPYAEPNERKLHGGLNGCNLLGVGTQLVRAVFGSTTHEGMEFGLMNPAGLQNPSYTFEGGWFQVINYSTSSFVENPGGRGYVVNPRPVVNELDVDYASGAGNYKYPKSSDLSAKDSPMYKGLADDPPGKLHRQGAYTMWYMVRPKMLDMSSAIWVPVARLDWAFFFDANWDGNTEGGRIVSAAHVIGAEGGAAGADVPFEDTTTFPTWSGLHLP